MIKPPHMTLIPNGPYVISDTAGLTVLFARSRTDATLAELSQVEEDGSARLCRCGQSSCRPACDGTCESSGFIADPQGEEPPIEAEEGVAPRLAFIEDGPVMAAGIIINHEDGSSTDLTDGELAMCRCGASRSKPWCDFSHLRVNFRSR